MYGGLFMTDQHMIDSPDRMQRIINIEDRAPRITKYLLHTLIDERSHDHLGSRQHLHGLPPLL
ncbi:hypothetical protein D3C73_1489250 [compost metagenome]